MDKRDGTWFEYAPIYAEYACKAFSSFDWSTNTTGDPSSGASGMNNGRINVAKSVKGTASAPPFPQHPTGSPGSGRKIYGPYVRHVSASRDARAQICRGNRDGDLSESQSK